MQRIVWKEEVEGERRESKHAKDSVERRGGRREKGK